MIRKILGAALGAKIAKNSPVLGGAAGTVVATALPFVLSRMALPGLVLLGVGAYVLNRQKGTGTATDPNTVTPMKRAKGSSGPVAD